MYKNIEQAMAGLSVWKKHRRTVVKSLSNNLAYKPTFEADYLREALMYRFIELIESSNTAGAKRTSSFKARITGTRLVVVCPNKVLVWPHSLVIKNQLITLLLVLDA
ncbi:MAG: hypothetical protein GY710_08705 [Desulfobacteraceae bacterium]|nr:hypothetical protein [Desulfobacteraceae bacterium]